MKWKKLGKIFDPTEHILANNCMEFAQSPQALVFDDFVRIYFSTREMDDNGKYLSHISFVDFNKKFNKILNVASETVIPLGALGCFDEHGIFPMSILRNAGNVYGYTCGISRRVSVSVESSIGLAISYDDGLTFSRYGSGPILTASLYEPFLVCDPFVGNYDEKFHMWYAYGTKWIRKVEKDRVAYRVYKIGHAVSEDGIKWAKDGEQLIKDKLNADECQALPTVFHFKGKYHMYFCYRQAEDFKSNRNNSYRLGYATSADLKNWVRDDATAGIDVSEEGWDSNMMCYPNVFKCNNEVYLLYNGNDFGRNGFGIAKLKDG
jgi:sucrose-6-phosphate hydrolase SacC (GH32 family)